MLSRCCYKHTLLCVCSIFSLFQWSHHSATELSCCCWQMSVWMMCAGISGCWSALLTNQSDWNQQELLELYAGVVVQKVSLDVLSRRFEQHILKPEPTSRSIASKSWNDADRRSLNNVTLKRSSDRRTGPSPYSRVRTCYVQENIVVQVKLTLFTSDFTSDMNIALLVGSPVLVWPEHPSWTSRSFNCSSSRPPLLP